MRLQNYLNVQIGNPIFVGISCMSGQQIRYAIDFAKKVRNENPSCPIVWGGVHPTLLPQQTIENEMVDIVVRGEGDLVVAELAKSLAACIPLENVKGITFKTNGSIVNTQDADLIDLNQIPLELPYSLFEMSKYPALTTGRFHIQTSRGCPHRCSFCYNTDFNKRKWRAKNAKRVIQEIKHILQEFPQVKIVDPIDDNFFVDQHRVKQICEGLIAEDTKIRWRANCRFDYFSDYDQDFLGLLEKSGCTELDFGGECGSEQLQEFINKDVTEEQMLESVSKLKQWAPTIEPFISWLSGLPDETYNDVLKTFELMDELKKANPLTQHYGIFIYTPFPSPLLKLLGSKFQPPESLEDWGKIDVFVFQPPWHSKAYVEKLKIISAITRYAFYPSSRIQARGLKFRLSYGIMNQLARYRLRHRFFGFPIEIKIVDAVVKRIRGFL